MYKYFRFFLSLQDLGLTPEAWNSITNIGQAAVVAGGTITTDISGNINNKIFCNFDDVHHVF